jgi:hypothetical protein
VLIPNGGDNRLFRKASGLCYFAGLGTQSHATSISCLVDRRLSHLSDIFIHGRGHPTMIRYFETADDTGPETLDWNSESSSPTQVATRPA